jgi:hypothetical protein
MFAPNVFLHIMEQTNKSHSKNPGRWRAVTPPDSHAPRVGDVHFRAFLSKNQNYERHKKTRSHSN